MPRVSPYLIKRVRMSIEKITVTANEVLEGFRAAGAISTAKTSPEFKLKMADFKYRIRQHGMHVEEALKDLQFDHAKKDSAGKPVLLVINGTEIPNQFIYEDQRAFEKAQRTMLAQPREIEVPLFTQEEFKVVKESEGDWEGIVPFVKELRDQKAKSTPSTSDA